MQACPNRNLLMALPSWDSKERRCGGGLGCYYNLTKKLAPCGSCGWTPTTADYRYAIVSVTPVTACPVCFFENWLSGEDQKYTCQWAPCRAMRAAVRGDHATMMGALFESHIAGILPTFAPGLPQLALADIGMTVPPGVAEAAGPPPPPAAGPAAAAGSGPPPPPPPADDDIAMERAKEEACHLAYLAELAPRLLERVETLEGVQQAQAERIETGERVQREQAAEIQYLKRQTHQHLKIEQLEHEV